MFSYLLNLTFITTTFFLYLSSPCFGLSFGHREDLQKKIVSVRKEDEVDICLCRLEISFEHIGNLIKYFLVKVFFENFFHMSINSYLVFFKIFSLEKQPK